VQLAKVSIYDWLGWRHGARLADVCQETFATECGPAAVFLVWHV
jgi:phage tail protein X